MNYASYSYHNYYLRLLTNLTKAICRGLGRVMGWKAILLTMSVGIQTISGDRSVLRDVHVLGGVVVSVGFLSFFQTFHLPPFLVSEFDLEDPVEVAVGVLEGWGRGVRGVEQSEVELLLLGQQLGVSGGVNGGVMGVQVDGVWEEHVLGGQNGRTAKIRFYYTILYYQSFIWT